MIKDTGGPAYPPICREWQQDREGFDYFHGMTLLDWFAGCELKGMDRGEGAAEALNEAVARTGRAPHEIRADLCYQQAAAMIAGKRRREADAG